jgi:hypothetical protein
MSLGKYNKSVAAYKRVREFESRVPVLGTEHRRDGIV